MEQEKTNDLLLIAEQVINQSHYSRLSDLEIIPLDEGSKEIQAGNVMCLFRISELVYDEKDLCTDKFPAVFSALHACGASCLMILECIEGRSELYLGAINKQRCENVSYLNVIRDILKSSICGNLPGSDIREIVSRKEIRRVLHSALDNGFDSQCITSVSCVSGLQAPSGGTEHGMETLLGSVRDRNFSIIVMADPVSNEQIDVIKKGYEDLGTSLSAMESVSVTMQTGSNYSTSTNVSVGINESLSRGISLSQSHTVTGNYRKEKSGSEIFGDAGKTIAKLGAGAIALIGTEGNIGAAYMAMNAMDQLTSLGKSIAPPAAQSKELALKSTEIQQLEEKSGAVFGLAPDSVAEAHNQQQSMNLNQQQGRSQQVGQGESMTKVESTSVQSNTRDIHITELNDKLMKYLSWLNRSRNFGMFNCCTYIISDSAGTNLFVAGQYQALIQSYGENEQPITMNTWTKENGIEQIRESLLHLLHPSFEYAGAAFSPAMLMSSKELSRQMSLPKKPILGVSVANHAAFGVEVVRKSSHSSGALVHLGQVQHMGKTTGEPILLDLQTLASHTFIAGTNGSGKSNTAFSILEELLRLKVPFMVIEPAKGEYKNIFGNEPNVAVYGTNPRKSKLLSINPFWFNEEITVREHIDKLIEIFNASWSMYAAMPAVLKASIENAYKSCGWNLKTSDCLGARRFPTFRDVLAEFGNKMESTAFSAELKGNYVGALSTRMESLCNGIYEDIFLGENLSDEALFDSNVLVDLSRVGSSETKAMIMGFLIVRLQEYRMKNEALNLPLQHITVLEEAHHLLRRTSSAQSDEGSNLLGKSVEMISNMIAEMRSYGEGFMIVDQSPGLLDMSVMRNTNTKIIMRLLENSDRELVGNTIGLNGEQKVELSRLGTGVCAIYQKEWLEPVLCQVDPAAHKASLYSYTPPAANVGSEMSVETARGIAFSLLTPLKKGEVCAMDALQDTSKVLQVSGDLDRKLADLLMEYMKTRTPRQKGIIEPYASMIWELLEGDAVWPYLFRLISENNRELFDAMMREQIRKYISCCTDTQTSIISLFLQKKGAVSEVKDFYKKWTWKYILNK